ncbi:MAG: hypothetical protein Q9190_005914 [Brigantiaea leucoxantha]
MAPKKAATIAATPRKTLKRVAPSKAAKPPPKKARNFRSQSVIDDSDDGLENTDDNDTPRRQGRKGMPPPERPKTPPPTMPNTSDPVTTPPQPPAVRSESEPEPPSTLQVLAQAGESIYTKQYNESWMVDANTYILPIWGSYFEWRVKREKEKKNSTTIKVKPYIDTLKAVSESADYETRVLKNSTTRIIKNNEVRPSFGNRAVQIAVHLPATLIHLAYTLFKADPERFNQPMVSNIGYFGYAVDDWMRAFCLMTYINKRFAERFTNAPKANAESKPALLLWGDAHRGEAALPAGAATDSSTALTHAGQVNDVIRLTNAYDRISGQLGFVDPTERPTKTNEDDSIADRTKRTDANFAMETFTTLLFSSSVYPKRDGTTTGRVNVAPPLSRQDQWDFIELLSERVTLRYTDAADSALTLQALLKKANGLLDADAENLQRRANLENNIIDTEDKGPSTDVMQHETQVILGESSEAVTDKLKTQMSEHKRLLDSAAILTNESCMQMADFLETLKTLNWMDRLEQYEKTGKIPVNPNATGRLADFGLEPGQICDIGTILKGFQNPMKAVLLANEAGAGKTFAMMGAMLAHAETLEASHKSGKSKGPYYPVMLLIPPNLVSQYTLEFLKSYDGVLELSVWYGTTKSGSQERTSRTSGLYLGSLPEDVNEWYKACSTEDPANARRILLTSYQTLTNRAGEQLPNPSGHKDDQEYAYNHDVIVSKWLASRDMNFDKIVFTSATPLANSDQDLYSYLKILWPSNFLLSKLEDVVDNGKLDFRDFYKTEINLRKVPLSNGNGIHNFVVESRYKSDPAYQNFIDQVHAGKGWHMLHPMVYFHAYNTFHTESWFADKVLSSILSTFQTRRLITTPIWDGTKLVVKTLPESNMKVLVLDFDRPIYRTKHDEMIYSLISDLFIPDYRKEDLVYENADDEASANIKKDKFDISKMDANIYRQLRMMTTHQDFYHLIKTSHQAERLAEITEEMVLAMKESGHSFDYPSFRPSIEKSKRERQAIQMAQPSRRHQGSSGATVDDIKVIRDCDPTGGLAIFFLATNREPEIAFPTTEPTNILRFCVAKSPKYLAFLVELYNITRRPQFEEDKLAAKEKREAKRLPQQRVICFFGNPATQAFGEALCKMFGFTYRAIRADLPDPIRNQYIADFKNPNNAVEVLITSTLLSSQGLNLQDCCNHMLIVELPTTVPALIQVIARIVRLGQEKPTFITMFHLHDSFDDFVITRAFKKYLSTWAAESLLREKLPDCGEAIKLIGCELIRVKIGLPFLPYGTDRTNRAQLKVAHAFSKAVQPKVMDLFDLETAKQYHMDYIVAMKFRQIIMSGLRSLWAKYKTESPPSFPCSRWFSSRPDFLLPPLLPEDFRLTCPAGRYRRYTMPVETPEDSDIFIIYTFMFAQASTYFNDEDRDPASSDSSDSSESDSD